MSNQVIYIDPQYLENKPTSSPMTVKELSTCCRHEPNSSQSELIYVSPHSMPSFSPTIIPITILPPPATESTYQPIINPSPFNEQPKIDGFGSKVSNMPHSTPSPVQVTTPTSFQPSFQLYQHSPPHITPPFLPIYTCSSPSFSSPSSLMLNQKDYLPPNYDNRVRCPSCNAILQSPLGTPTFYCPCGLLLNNPHFRVDYAPP